MSGQERNRSEDIDKLISWLEPWRGGFASIVSFNSSHDQLIVWLTKPKSELIEGEAVKGGVLLICSLCAELSFRPAWGPTNISVSGDFRAFSGKLREKPESIFT